MFLRDAKSIEAYRIQLLENIARHVMSHFNFNNHGPFMGGWQIRLESIMNAEL